MSSEPEPPAPDKSKWEKYGPSIFLLLLTIGVITGFVAILLFAPTNLLDGSAEATRVFLALTFGAGIFIIAFMCLLVLVSQVDTDEAVKRFSSAKELFTALLAIFGTIIGFYFGTSQNNTESRSPMETELIVELSKLGIARPEIPNDKLEATRKITSDITTTPDQKREALEDLLPLPPADAPATGAATPANGGAPQPSE